MTPTSSDRPADATGAGPGPADGPAPAGGGATDLVLRVLGGGLALLAGFLTAVLAVLLVPLRVADLAPGTMLAGSGVGDVRLPVAVLVAAGGALFSVWFARRAVGSRWAAALPALGWFVMVVAALQTTTEGDRLLLPDDWVAALTLFGGTLVVVIGVTLSFTSGGRATRPDPTSGR